MQSTPLTRPPFVAGSVPEYRTPELLINGRWRSGRGALRIAVCNPATEEPLGDFSSASTEDLAEALAASELGFAAWRQRPARERAEILERGVARMLERLETIAIWLTLEQGKTLAESRQEVQVAAEMIKWYAEESRRVYGRLASSRLVGAHHGGAQVPGWAGVGPFTLELPGDIDGPQDRWGVGGRMLGDRQGCRGNTCGRGRHGGWSPG